MEACDCMTFHWPSSRTRTAVIRTERSPPPAAVNRPRPFAQAMSPLDVGVDVVAYRLDLVRTAGGGHGVYDLLARLPLCAIGADMSGIRTLREHGPHLLGIACVLRLEQLVKHRRDFNLGPVQPCASPPRLATQSSVVAGRVLRQQPTANSFRRAASGRRRFAISATSS